VGLHLLYPRAHAIPEHYGPAGQGIVLGYSDTPAWIVSKANEYARQNGLRQFSVYQGKWSAASRDFERDIIPMCRDEGMGICPWGALGGGNFKTEEQRKSNEGRKMVGQFEVSEKDKNISRVLEKIADKYQSQITSVALAYVMTKTPYVFPIIGGRKIDHLKGNIDGLRLALTEEDMDEIEGAAQFDIGFPQAFLGGPKGVTSPNDVWLVSMAGVQNHVAPQKVCSDLKLITWTSLTLPRQLAQLRLIINHGITQGLYTDLDKMVDEWCIISD
jgi:hypothetical protein